MRQIDKKGMDEMKRPTFLLYVHNGRKIQAGPFEKHADTSLWMGAELFRKYGFPEPGDQVALVEVIGNPATRRVSFEATTLLESEIEQMVDMATRMKQSVEGMCHGTRMAPAYVS